MTQQIKPRVGELLDPAKRQLVADAARFGMKRYERKVVERTLWATMLFDHDIDPGHPSCDPERFDLVIDHVANCLLAGIEWRIITQLLEAATPSSAADHEGVFLNLSLPSQRLVNFINTLPDAKSWWTLDMGDWPAL